MGQESSHLNLTANVTSQAESTGNPFPAFPIPVRYTRLHLGRDGAMLVGDRTPHGARTPARGWEAGMTAKARTLAKTLTAACRRLYGERLCSVAVFGSHARGTATPVSDIDVLIVAERLPSSRRRRVAEFAAVEDDTCRAREALWPLAGVPAPPLSPVLKTRAEVAAGSPLFLDMTEWCEVLWDPEGFLRSYLAGLRARLEAQGSRRRPAKGGYYWDYKPNAAPLEVVEL
jgi:predicted nucleotidyltransferase